MKTHLILMCSLILILSPFLSAHQQFKDLTLDSAGIRELDIECGAGFLKISTEKGLSRINVEAEIIVEGMNKDKASKYIQDEVVLSLKKRGDTAYLISKFRPMNSFFSTRERSINLTVHIPSEINLDVDDGSGSIWIENVKGALKVHDGSGDMRIRNISKGAKITDGSGNMDLYDITGNVKIDDGSGNMDIEGVRGNLHVNDGSGNFTAKDIQGMI
ncbi:MAG: hypothetical protein GF421_01375, partial [Candidatus Aminicenantes bacterium]|nr:hypothetical protein [Candidatus Aminicenantes bacterium]